MSTWTQQCCHLHCRLGKVLVRLRDAVSKYTHNIHKETCCWRSCREGQVQEVSSRHSHGRKLLLPYRMGKMPVRLREVAYTLSPFETTVLNGLWKDLPQKAHRKISEVSCMAWALLLGQELGGCDSGDGHTRWCTGGSLM